MKRKTINAVLTKKFTDFLNSIEDDELKKLVKKNSIITGGSIASMINNEEVKDFDIYFTDRETTLAVANYYVDKFKELNPNISILPTVMTKESFIKDNSYAEKLLNKQLLEEELTDDEQHYLDTFIAFKDNFYDDDRVLIFISSVGVASEETNFLNEDEEDIAQKINENELDNNKPKYRPVFLSTNAITLSDKIQLIIRFFGDADKIHENFDYLHATNYWTSKDNKLTLKLDAFEACHNKELIYIGSKYPVCSIFRMRKFLERGFRITAGEILKIAMNVNEFDLTNVRVLRDQLVGVDSAYFNMLIQSIKNKESIDRIYITDLINKMYN